MSETEGQGRDGSADAAAYREIETLWQKMANDPEYKPRWENRRKVIFRTLYLCGLLVTAIVLVPLIADVMSGSYAMDREVSLVLTNALYVLALIAATVIGSYVFGAAFDHNGYRRYFKEIAQVLAGGKQR